MKFLRDIILSGVNLVSTATSFDIKANTSSAIVNISTFGLSLLNNTLRGASALADYVQIVDYTGHFGQLRIGGLMVSDVDDSASIPANGAYIKGELKAGSLTEGGTPLATKYAPAHTVVTDVSNLEAAGSLSTDYIMSSTELSVSLTAGTWLVVAQVTAFNTTAVDSLQIVLYNHTAAADIANTKGPVQTPPQLNYPMTLMTVAPVTLASTATVGVKVIRNGGSTPNVGNAGGNNLTDVHRIIAVKLAG